jgi:NAD(P)-dependent dehydrogenase (short-subunit alcohol dehydrogenase family)
MDTFTSVETITQAEYERIMAVNLNAPIWLMHEVVKVMKVLIYAI